MSTQTNTPTIQEKNISDSVMVRVHQFVEAGELKLPANYSAENALKSAFLMLQVTVDKDKKLVLDVCTKESIANTLLDMVIQGLSPVKKQCYFVAYGNKLTLSRSYMGTIAVAKRISLADINSQVIYAGDKFHYIVDQTTGRKKLVEHIQDFQNINNEKILGAYAITITKDGKTDLEVMNLDQIKKAWQQGQAKGVSGAHTNFTDQMCKKTVESRACKLIINTSDDGELYKSDPNAMDLDIDTEDQTHTTATVVKEEIKSNGNNTPLAIDTSKETVILDTNKKQPEPVIAAKEETKTATNNNANQGDIPF